MIIDITKLGHRIMFVPETGQEVKKLNDFPGLLRDGPDYYCVVKPHVVYNLVERLKSKIKKLKISKAVQAMIDADFKLSHIPSTFSFITNPFPFQEIALRYLLTVGSGGLLLEPGMGKTKIILDYISAAGLKKVVIVCPSALCFVWEDETKTHRHDKVTYVIKSTDFEKELPGIARADIVVVNYAKAVILLEHLKKQQFQGIFLDEFLIKDYKSQRTIALTELAQGIPVRVGMSGTLVNNSAEDVFAPIRFLEPSLIGTGITRFKKEYAITARNDPRIIFGYRRLPEIRSILESCSIVMTKEEWLHVLPKKIDKTIQCMMSDDQRNWYDFLQSNYAILDEGNLITYENPLTIAMKLIQISQGFVYIDEDIEDLQEMCVDLDEKPKKKKTKRRVHIFKEQPKAEALIKLLKSMPTRRSLIWYNFAAEKDIIEKYLTDNGFKYLTISGGEKDIGGKVREFNKNNDVQYLVCQAKSVNYGITTMGNDNEDQVNEVLDSSVFTEIFYSINYSLEVYLQQRDRVHRIGQKHDCEYYHLIANSEMDKRIFDAISNKIVLRKEMLVDWAIRTQ